jgi:phage terminase large subunit
MKQERVLCCREFQQSISASVIQLLSDQISYMGLADMFDVQAKAIYCKHNGSSIKFAGLAHNISSIKSMEGITIAWVEEAHNVTKISWNTLIPTIRTPSSEIWVSFNPDDELDETYLRFVEETPTNAYVVKINYDQNPWFPPVLEEERLDCLAKSEAEHRHIWLGYPREVIEGAYWAKELGVAKEEGRITIVAHDPKIPVMTSFDLGMGNATVVWFFQETPGSIRVIDIEVYKRTKIADIIKSPLSEDVKRGLLDKPYRYSQHIFPHDVRVQEQGTGLSRKEMYENLGIEVTVAPGPAEVSRDDGIEAVDMMLPKMWFDKGKCNEGIKALRRYQTEYNVAKKVFSKAPLHDWTSDYADSMRMFAITPHETQYNTWGSPIDYSNSNVRVI